MPRKTHCHPIVLKPAPSAACDGVRSTCGPVVDSMPPHPTWVLNLNLWTLPSPASRPVHIHTGIQPPLTNSVKLEAFAYSPPTELLSVLPTSSCGVPKPVRVTQGALSAWPRLLSAVTAAEKPRALKHQGVKLVSLVLDGFVQPRWLPRLCKSFTSGSTGDLCLLG